MALVQRMDLAEWIEKHHLGAKYDLCSSSASSISIDGLLDISERRADSEESLALNKTTLTANECGAGNVELRKNLAALYSARSGGVTEDNLLITSGGTAAISTVFAALLAPGDHAICQHPVEERLYKNLVRAGAEITTWNADPGKKWQLDVDELKNLIRNNTKCIVIQSPCDPTGAIVPKPVLEHLIEIAEGKNLFVVADESFRPLFHSILPSSEDFPPSTINLGYKKVIVMGTVSKAYSLAGIQTGWIATKDADIMDACKRVRRLAATHASALDEAVAAEAISDRCIHALLARNIRLCQTNLEHLQSFIEEHSWACSWVKPLAGTTAMVKFHKMGKPVEGEGFCLTLLHQAGLLICPASKCFGDDHALRGYVRVAFGGSTEEVNAALVVWKAFMEESFESVPTVSSKATASS